jgi:hypothetical protein
MKFPLLSSFRSFTFVAVFAGVATVTGCGGNTPALSPAAAQVAIARQPPGPGCKTLGYIVGEGGGSGAFGGKWVSNDKLIEYAETDLRNKASDLGGNYVEIDSAPTLGNSHGTTSTATLSGTAFRCDAPGVAPVVVSSNP